MRRKFYFFLLVWFSGLVNKFDLPVLLSGILCLILARILLGYYEHAADYPDHDGNRGASQIGVPDDVNHRDGHRTVAHQRQAGQVEGGVSPETQHRFPQGGSPEQRFFPQDWQ